MTIHRKARTEGAARGRPWVPMAGVMVAVAVVVPLSAAGCGSSAKSPPAPSTVPATTTITTTTTMPASSNLSVQGVKPAVLQAPFYPMTTVSAVTCGTGPGGRFVRADLPPGPAGTSARSGLAQPSFVIIVPGKAELRDHNGRAVYTDASRGITTATHGSLVLALIGPSGNVVQVNGDYACPDVDVAYPGT